MTDILGPASDAFAVTARPGDARTFGAVDTFFTDCTSATAGDGTDVSSAFLNALIANQRAVVRGNGTTKAGALVVPNDNSDGMTLAALQHLGQRAVYARAVDSGAVNAIMATFTPAPPEVLDGMTFSVKAKATNTGPATFNGLPVVTRAGAALTGGEIVGGAWQDYRFDATRNAYQIGTSASGAAATPQNALVHDGSATGGNTLVTTLVPAIAAPLQAGLWMAVPITTANTGPMTLDFGGGFGTPAPMGVVSNKTGVALVGGETLGGVGFIAWFYYDGNAPRLMNPQTTSVSKIVVATVNGTYTPTPGAKRVQGLGVGPGGPGGNSNGSPGCVGAGGGAGAASIFDIDLTATPGPFVYAIGAPAAPSSASAATATVAPLGSPTTFGSSVVAPAGQAGLNSVECGVGGLGGSGGTGLLALPGNPGDGVVGNINGGSAISLGIRGGNGGASILGGAGQGADSNTTTTNNAAPGGAAVGFGSGGGGADSGGNGTAVAGGPGAPGVIIYREVF